MTEQQKMQALRAQCMELMKQRDIAGYLHTNCEKFIHSLNSWKLEALIRNHKMFKRFLYLLDDQNTAQLNCKIKDRTYMSARGHETIMLKKKALTEYSPTRALKITAKIEALFVFQAPEFCNGSMTRMQIIDFSKIRDAIVRRLHEQPMK